MATGSEAAAAVVVIPCFNERQRLDPRAVARLASRDDVHVLLVDDGSTDGTRVVLDGLASRFPGRIDVLALARNWGKGEAVRLGLCRALDGGAPIVGYLDADLSTPIEEARRLIECLRAMPVQVVLAARVKLLGRTIERRASRHYTGRVFATIASMVLGLPVYDTQCGAKFFRRSPLLAAALARPFRSRWSFDVELLQRLLVGCGGERPLDPREVIEEPLKVWRDVLGSKLGLAAALRATFALLPLAGSRLRSLVASPRRGARESARAVRVLPG